MAKPEELLYGRVQRELKKLKGDEHPIWWFKIHGSAMQQRGLPDLCVVWYGRAFFFELKARGNKPTRLQSQRMKEIGRAWGTAVPVWDAETVTKTLLDRIPL